VGMKNGFHGVVLARAKALEKLAFRGGRVGQFLDNLSRDTLSYAGAKREQRDLHPGPTRSRTLLVRGFAGSRVRWG
jgi:hypothetical protein